MNQNALRNNWSGFSRRWEPDVSLSPFIGFYSQHQHKQSFLLLQRAEWDSAWKHLHRNVERVIMSAFKKKMEIKQHIYALRPPKGKRKLWLTF